MIDDQAYNTLKWEREEEVGWLFINRPKKMNALNGQVLDDLNRLFDECRNESDLRGIIVRGTGDRAFVAGADIRELKELNKNSGVKAARKGQAVFDKIEQMPIPVLAAVNGYALGGGTELAMACHLRIASENAVFGQPEVGLGLIPGYGGTQRLPRLVGRTRALEMILTGEPIEADEAAEYGLVNRVVSADELNEEAHKLMNAVTNNAPLAVEKALQAIVDEDSGAGFNREAEIFGELCGTEDAEEGMTAFLEQRNPDFQGR